MNKIVIVINRGLVIEVFSQSEFELIVLDKDIDGIDDEELKSLDSLNGDDVYI